MSSFLAYLTSNFVCCQWVKKPFQSLDEPTKYDLKNTDYVRVPVNGTEDDSIGAWFCHPLEENENEQNYVVGANEIAFLYLHGNTETRSQFHRCELYRVLQRANHHILAIDYRGFADSSKITPNEVSMMQDAESAFKWLLEKSHPQSKIVVWGHSLGTGVASKLANRLCTCTYQPAGYILEAPFTSLKDEIESFTLSRFLPFDLANLLKESHLEFDNLSNLAEVRNPILVLHAEDDKIIPFSLGKRLAEELKKSKDTRVDFKMFSQDQGLGHNFIVRSSQIEEIIEDFIYNI